jgi:hypothetical protein
LKKVEVKNERYQEKFLYSNRRKTFKIDTIKSKDEAVDHFKPLPTDE